MNLVCLNYPPEPTGVAVYTGALADDLVERGSDVRVITGMPHYPQWRIYDGYGKSRTEIGDGVTVARRRHSVPANPQLVNRLGMELTFGLNAVMAPWSEPDVVVLLAPRCFRALSLHSKPHYAGSQWSSGCRTFTVLPSLKPVVQALYEAVFLPARKERS